MKKFAFLIHPRDASDVARRWLITRFLPEKLVEGIGQRLKGRLGFTICSKFGVEKLNKKVEGYILGVFLNGKQMLTLPRKIVRQRILDIILFAQNKLGVEIVGLGSLITSVTEGGEWLVQQPEVKAILTHGDSYATAVAEEGIEKILDICKLAPQNAKIAVVGAYGLIGREIVKFLAEKGYSLILIEKTEEKVNLIKEKLKEINLENRFFSASTDLENILPADLVITTTSHPSSLIKSEHLKKRAIIYDVAQPMNVSPKLIEERPDIIKIDGGYVDIDGIDLKFDMGPPEGATFACLTETMMMALEGEKDYHVGEIDEDYMKKTKEWAKKYGFFHAPFTCFGKPISIEKFLRIENKKF